MLITANMMLCTSLRLTSARKILRAPAASLDYRDYHASAKREILPLVAAAAVLAIGRYSWRAMKRMEDEWEDYQWLLQEYEKKNGPVLVKSPYPDGTIAIDLGTIHLKMAHANPKSVVVANRTGGQYTFAGVVQTDDEVLLGQRALDRFYQSPPGQAKLPYRDASAIPPVISEALHDLLSQKNASQIRSILTIPPIADLPEALFTFNATLVPEPVAAVWGAQQQQVLPATMEGPILVVDVGGFRTTLSLIQKNVVLTSVALGFGGELYANKVVEEIVKDQPSLANDPMAMQRIHVAAISAVHQYNSNTQAQIHVPYISMDMETRQPQHLDVVISRSTIERLVQEDVVTNHLSPGVLSNVFPKPTDLASTWISVLTLLLTHVNLTPMQVQYVLLVGGGSKQVLVAKSLQDCLQALQGNADNFLVPDSRSELVALGAASMLPNYEYSPEKGLVRKD
jgi:hypothetical protein